MSSMSSSSNKTYSPFDCLVCGQTTSSGLLEKLPNEVEIKIVADCFELRGGTEEEPMMLLDANNVPQQATDDKKWQSKISNLQIIITTHRIVFLNATRQQARYIHLSNIFSVSTETLYFKSPKILLNTTMGELILAFKDHKTQRDEIYNAIQLSLSRKQWEHETSATTYSTRQKKSASHQRVGVDAILRNKQHRHQQAAHLTNTAFDGDAETLLREATELVKIIQKYVATLDRNDSEQSNQLVTLMNDMGMIHALDKSNISGKAYFEQTARQLADFMRPRLHNTTSNPSSTCMTLTDVYCVFNRARGTHLLSPEDLLTTVEILETLDLGFSVQTFPSGLKVLRLSSQDDESLGRQFLEMLETTEYLTSTMVSRQFQIPVVLAYEQLQAAVQAEILVVDETLESVCFYPNKFNEFFAALQ